MKKLASFLLLGTTLTAIGAVTKLPTPHDNSAPEEQMFPDLPKFHYTPTKRDPFVSPAVTSPYVTVEEDISPTFDKEKYEQALKAFKDSIASVLKVNGISEGSQGLPFALINGEIYHPGDDIDVPLTQDVANIISTAAALATESGKKLPIADTQTSISLEFSSLQGKRLTLRMPDSNETVELVYKKNLSTKPKAAGNMPHAPSMPTGVYKPSTAK
jgi:hypothetical protein